MTGIGAKSAAPGLHTVTCGSGRPVVILHGGGLDHRHMMDALEPVFASTQGWRRLFVDLPGHGRSPADESISSQDDVLASVIAHCDALLSGEQFAVIGESRGSYLAQGIASRCPDRLLGLMLVCAGSMSQDGRHRLPEHRTLVSLETPMGDLPEALRARVARLVAQTPEIVEKILQTKLPAAELADRAMAERIAGHFTFSFDPMSGPPFDKPVLILNGRQDAITGYAEMTEALDHYPRATFAVLDRAGHSLSWEQPEVFAALTHEWLRRMEVPMARTTSSDHDAPHAGNAAQSEVMRETR